MNIAFCINGLGIAGLGATVSSLIRNCSDPNRLSIWFLCAGLSNPKKRKISSLLTSEGFKGIFNFIDFEPKTHFGALSPLHGDWTAYGRLLLADILDEEQVLYLDSDLIIELDVLEVEKFDFAGNVLAAVGGGSFEYTVGSKFYTDKLGISPELEYFNSGVLLLNLHEWRLQRIKEKCLSVASQFALELPSHDQSLLNIICAGNFAKLPPAFNCAWIADKPRPAIAERMVLHFKGSPKPWDPLGSLIHNGYHTWKKYSNPGWNSPLDHLGFASYKRTWHIRRSYIRCLLSRVKA